MVTEQPEPIQDLAVERKAQLLQSVNVTLAGLQSTLKYKRIFDAIPGCEVLRGKKIVMVDDMQSVLESFVAPLMVVTDGHALFMQYKGQLLEDLLQELLAAQPEIVLVDFHLSETVKGDALVRMIAERHPEITCIGFSSDKDAKHPFLKAGVQGVAPKEAHDPDVSLQAVAKLIA